MKKLFASKTTFKNLKTIWQLSVLANNNLSKGPYLVINLAAKNRKKLKAMIEPDKVVNKYSYILREEKWNNYRTSSWREEW